MTHDYASGLHYSLVQYGGFLRNGCGWSQANLVRARALESVECMRLVRQRFTPQGVVNETDNGSLEGDESETTSSTAQGGGGSFKNRKPIGEVGCCESGMAERSH